MVFGGSWGGGFRRRGRGWGPPPGYGYGPPPGYGYGGGYRRGGGSCLRDLLFLDAGCCLAESLGCGPQLILLAPTLLRDVRGPAVEHSGSRPAGWLLAAIGSYQRRISPRHGPTCRFTPTCSAYGAEAVARHGARRGSWLTVRRLLRCRPGARGGSDPVPT